LGNKNQHIQGTPHVMRCIFEKDIASLKWDGKYWFNLIQDTSRDGDGKTRLCHTKIYQLYKDQEPCMIGIFGKKVGIFAHFYYDLRDNYAKVDISPVASKFLEHKQDLDVKKIKELN
jgi:hypothetical protein